MYIKTIFTLLVFSLLAKAQIKKFGDVDIADLNKEFCFLDSTAEAEVLFEKATTYFKYSDLNNHYTETEFHYRVKIYKPSALSRGSITLNAVYRKSSEREFISGIKAATYNLENGKVVKEELSKKDIYWEEILNNSQDAKINLQNVKVGSVIEVMYTKTTPLVIRNTPPNWYFQQNIPVALSHYDVTIPAHFYYQINFGGYLPLSKSDQEVIPYNYTGYSSLNTNALHYTFEVTNAPAFLNEKYITSTSDFISKVTFDLSSIQFPNSEYKSFNATWEDLDNTLRTNSYWGEKLKSRKITKETADLFVNYKEPEAKLNAIHKYVSTNFKWDGSVSVWAKDDQKILEDTKKGSSSELNLMLCAILREAGLDANPAILSTREHGRFNVLFPVLDKFNYTIVAVMIGEKLVFVDATDPLSPPGFLPERANVPACRVILSKSAYFTDLKVDKRHIEGTKMTIHVHPELGTLDGKMERSISGVAARDFLQNEMVNGKEKTQEEEWKDDNFIWKNKNVAYADSEMPNITFSADFESENPGIMPDMVYLDAIPYNGWRNNPFKKSERLYPVFFGNILLETVIVSYEIPPGFEVVSAPETKIISIPGGSGKLSFYVNKTENNISIMSRLSISKEEFFVEEYGNLKEFFSVLVAKHDEKIVLQKTGK